MEDGMDRLAQTVRTDDGRLLMFAEYGPSDGVPVLSFHGTPQCRLAAAWTVAVVTELGIRLIRYDRPGCGGSDRVAGRTVADSAGDACVVLDAAGVERAAVHGGSGGTPPAMALAALRSERVSCLALQAPIAPYTRLGHELWSRGQDEQTLEYMGLCLQGEDGAARAIERDLAELVDAGNPQADEFREAVRRGPGGAVEDELSQLADWGFDPASIAAPTLIVYDPNETVLPPQHAHWLRDRVPNATLMTTSTLGHRNSGEDRVPDLRRMYGWLIATGGGEVPSTAH
jgi:pimeloyl-ACP methyl ester carboxylesterase